MTYLHYLFTISIACCLAFLSKSATADDDVSTGPTLLKAEDNLQDFFGHDLMPFFPDGKPREENSGSYYVRAFDLYTSATKGQTTSVTNDPEKMAAMPEIQQALALIEQGAECGPCDFEGLYDFSASGYFQQRPDSIGIRMLAYLLFQRVVREVKLQRREQALDHAHRGIIFAAHMYISADTHTQATMSLEILSSAFGQACNVERELGSSFAVHNMKIMMEHYRRIMQHHVRLAPPIRSMAHYEYRLTLQNLLNPLPVVRMEGLRTLGNVIDPRVNPAHIATLSYRDMRAHVIQEQDNILLMLDNIARTDPEPRVQRLAADLHRMLQERDTFEPMVFPEDNSEHENLDLLIKEYNALKERYR